MCVLLATLLPNGVAAQERTVQHRPYIDQRGFHYGFFVGMHGQSLSTVGTGLIDPATGAQWSVINDRYDLGFNVGVLGEWRLTDNFSFRLLPSLYFGNKHLVFRDGTTGALEYQDMKTTYLSVPAEIKFAAPRFNNYRPYLLAGLMASYNLTRSRQSNLLMKPSNVYLELGMGCDFYLRFFKFIPEIKFLFGLSNILETDRSDLTDKSKLIFTESMQSAKSNMVVLTFYFE